MRYTAFSALAGLVAALPGQVERQVERRLAVSTVTAAAHPMTFWPLASLAPAATPLSYASPPKPSRVHPRNKVHRVDCTSAPPRQSSSSSFSSPATTSTHVRTHTPSASIPTCTIINGAYPTSTLPSFCRPTLFANAAVRASPARAAVVTIGANSVPDKVSCCAECAAYYNCFAWRFLPAYVDAPTERLPGGFDPWRHGGCEIAYHTGHGATDGAPSICPNGLVNETSNTFGNGKTSAGPRDPWVDGLFYNGWNEGACGGLGGVVFSGGRDNGVGDGASLCRV